MTLRLLLCLGRLAGQILRLGSPMGANLQLAALVFAGTRFRRSVSRMRAPSVSRMRGWWLIAAVCLRSPC